MNESIFRGSLLLISLALLATRFYYGRQARRGSHLLSISESQRSNNLLWLLGGVAALASATYILLPGWLTWATAPLPLSLRWLGVGQGVMTVALFVWVHRSLGRNWAMPLEQRATQCLVTSGPYRWLRHPMYSTLFIWAVAYLLVTANWAVGLSWMALVLAAARLHQRGGASPQAIWCDLPQLPRSYRALSASLVSGKQPNSMIRLLATGQRGFGLLGLLLLLAGCQAAHPVTPTADLTFDYSRITRATPRPVTPIPTITPGGATSVSFAHDIQPILAQRCVRCHGGIAGMWLTDYEHAILDSINGPTIHPGDPARSPLYIYVRDGLMPPDAPDLAPAEVELLGRWIAEGALPN